MEQNFETHTTDSEKEYARQMAKSEAIRRASETPEVTPRVTPEDTGNLSGGEVNSGAARG